MHKVEAWDTAEDAAEELTGYVAFTYTATHEYGWPEFTVVVDVDTFQEAWGPTCTTWQKIYEFLAHEYASWAEGSVYIVGVEDTATGETEYLSGIYEDGNLIDTMKRVAAYMGYDF